MYKIVALVGKSGSGKDRILRELCSNGNYHEIISNTTRPIRENEVDGVNYHYLTNEEFARKKANGEMLETADFREWHYGTSYDNLNENKVNIGVYNPTGYISLLENNNVEVLGIMVKCSDKERVLRQLNREEHPDVDEIIRRYSTDKVDFQYLLNYLNDKKNISQAFVVNDKGSDINEVCKQVDELAKKWLDDSLKE